MKELLAFLLPPATAMAGTRITRLILGKPFDETFGLGLRFAIGLAAGMFVFSQMLLLTALVGLNASELLAWAILIWGAIETVVLLRKIPAGAKNFHPQRSHGWLVLLIPAIWLLWEIGRLSVLDGTQEFDASAFWLLKARMLYLDQGKNLIALTHTANLSYAHMDYPLLVPALYALNYGAIGGINEYVVKVWPFWMVIAICAAIFSMGRIWKNPRPAPILLVVFFCFLPATTQFTRQEGGTMALLFGASMTAILFVMGLVSSNETTIAAGVLTLACCAMAKFEGIIYTAFWAVAITAFCWHRGWLKSRILWKAILIAGLCMLPYFAYRLTKPVLHPESNWLQEGATAPGAVLRRFPQTFFLSFGHRFFSMRFFHWSTPDKMHLQFDGKWEGIDSLSGPEFSLLPWIMLVLIGLSFWKKPHCRLILGALLVVILGELAFLSLAISCLPQMHNDLSEVIEFSGHIVGRYYYPFFTACFLGFMAVWLMEETPRPVFNSTPKAADAAPQIVSNPRQ